MSIQNEYLYVSAENVGVATEIPVVLNAAFAKYVHSKKIPNKNWEKITMLTT